MKLCLRILCALLLVSGSLTQGGFDLSDAFDDPEPTPPKQKPTPKPKPDDGLGFDLGDAIDHDPKPKTDKPAVVPPKSGGGGKNIDDSDLEDVVTGGYKPDGGHSGGRAMDPGSDTHGNTEQTQDPDHKWGQVLKLLYANVPEEFYVWMFNMKQVLVPLMERVQDLLQALQ